MSAAFLLLAAALQAAPDTGDAAVPFGVGETLEYSAKLGPMKLGDARLTVAGRDTVRGHDAWHLVFTIDIANFAYRSRDRIESWVRAADLTSLRFRKVYRNSKEQREELYEIHADSGYFTQSGKSDRKPTPAGAIDDAGFFYLVRTLPLEVGKTYTYTRYFRQDRNPVTIAVLGREKCDVPGTGETQCLVLHPSMDSKGLFGRKANARLWITDDARRLPVQIKSKFPFGTGTLKLETMRAGAASAARAAGG